MKRTLRIDIETFSSYDLPKVGVYRYVEAPDFEVMLFGYKWTGTKVPFPTACLDWLSGRLSYKYGKAEVQAHVKRCLDSLADEPTGDICKAYPPSLIRALVDPEVIKTAFNANFERTCLAEWLGVPMPPEQWRCTMVKSLYCGLPGDLFRVGQVLKTSTQKMAGGKALIHYFCKPCKPTKKNGQRTRNYPQHDPEKWALFRDVYCPADVDTEEAIDQRVSKVEMPEVEWRAWAQDQRINDRGIPVNTTLVESATKIGVDVKNSLLQRARDLTGIQNPNSVQQLVKWLNEEIEPLATGVPAVAALNKKTLPIIENLVLPDSKAAQLLDLRKRLAKASVSKYDAALRSTCKDGRLRGAVQFYGANRTGRWAGRLVQVHNMVVQKYSLFGATKKGEGADMLDLARDLVINTGDYRAVEMLYDDPMMVLSQLCRTMFEAPKHKVFGPVDFSAIEARGLAWKAKEQWRLDVFNGDGRIYEASAARMFKVPLASITKHSPYRAKGKVAELALGYGGGEGALINMGALEMGLTLQELDPLKVLWRSENRRITKLWWDVGDAAMLCVRTGKRQDAHGIGFRMHCGMLLMRLDSGRELCYVRPLIEDGYYGDEVTYEGMDQVTKQWVRMSSYGPKWIENWDQAFCRDLLRDKMLRMEECGLGEYIAFHVHDEVVPELPDPKILSKIEAIFAEPVPWALGMPLRGDGYITPYYVKEDD